MKRMNPLALTAVVVLAAVFFAALAWRSFHEVRSAVPASVAVMSFQNLTDPDDADRLSRMLTGLVSTELSGAADLSVVSQQRLYDVAAQLGHERQPKDRRSAATVARHAAAENMVIGEVVWAQKVVVATAEVVDVETGRSLASLRAEGQVLDDVFGMAESLGRQVRRALDAESTPRAAVPRSPSARLTSSVEAYRTYVAAEDLLHRHQFAAAIEGFREAVRRDPDFVLALYRLSIAASWIGDDEALGAAQEAMKRRDRLPPSLRDLIRVAMFAIEGRYSESIPLLEALLSENPADKEALYFLSEAYLHSGRDADVKRATEMMLRLEKLDPDFQLLRDHLALALIIAGRRAEADARLEAWVREGPEIMQRVRPMALALANRADEMKGRRPAGSGRPHHRAVLALLVGRWDEAREILADGWGEGHLSSLQWRSRGDLHAYQGEFGAALEAYGRAAQASSPRHQGLRNGIAGSAQLAAAELLELRGDLGGAREALEAAVRLQPDNPGPHYHAGSLALRDGDSQTAALHLDRNRRVTETSDGTLATLFERALEAEVLLARGEAERARRRYEEVIGSGALLDEWFTSYSSSGAVFRFGLARTCRALWDQEGETAALQGLVSSGVERLSHPALYVRALFRLGELYLEAGDEEKAREHLARFLDHWGDADWELPEVAEAREHLAP